MGKRGHCTSTELYFFMEKERKIINWEQDILFNTE